MRRIVDNVVAVADTTHSSMRELSSSQSIYNVAAGGCLWVIQPHFADKYYTSSSTTPTTSFDAAFTYPNYQSHDCAATIDTITQPWFFTATEGTLPTEVVGVAAVCGEYDYKSGNF